MFVFSTFHLIHFIWFFFEKAVQQKLSCVKQRNEVTESLKWMHLNLKWMQLSTMLFSLNSLEE